MTDAEKLRRIRDIVSLCNTPCSEEIIKLIDGDATQKKDVLTEYKKWLVENVNDCVTRQRYEIGSDYLIKEAVYAKCLKKIKEFEEKGE